MKWVYDLCGAEPIIKDVPVYDAATIQNGELLQLGLAAAGFYTAGTSNTFASACPTTVGATQGINALGISLESKTTADVPSVAALHNLTTGAFAYVKAIINPFAVYAAQVKTSTLGTSTENQLAVTGGASSATQQVIVTSLGTTGMFNGQWIYFSGTAGPNYGQLRKVATSASAGTCVLDAVCLSTITTADKVSFISNPGQLCNVLNGDALTVGQCSTGAETATNIRVVDNIIDRGAGNELLREAAHAGGKVNLSGDAIKVAKFYQHIMLKDHIYGTQ
jgi:hypothetical protein